jgi:hypothetical protein
MGRREGLTATNTKNVKTKIAQRPSSVLAVSPESVSIREQDGETS